MSGNPPIDCAVAGLRTGYYKNKKIPEKGARPGRRPLQKRICFAAVLGDGLHF
jgi:hypothetical protein